MSSIFTLERCFFPKVIGKLGLLRYIFRCSFFVTGQTLYIFCLEAPWIKRLTSDVNFLITAKINQKVRIGSYLLSYTVLISPLIWNVFYYIKKHLGFSSGVIKNCWLSVTVYLLNLVTITGVFIIFPYYKKKKKRVKKLLV